MREWLRGREGGREGRREGRREGGREREREEGKRERKREGGRREGGRREMSGRMEGGNTINYMHVQTHSSLPSHTHTHTLSVSPLWPTTVYPGRGTRSYRLRPYEPTWVRCTLASEELLEGSLDVLLPKERVDRKTLAQ